MMQIKQMVLQFIFVFLNLILFLLFSWSAYLHSSYFKCFPWYEKAGGASMVIFIYVFPVLVCIGILMQILNKFYSMLSVNKWLPFIPIVGFILSMVIVFIGNTAVALFEVLLNVSLCLVVIVTTIRSFLNQKN